MKAIIALEELIKEGENRLKLVKKQLADHESGENKLSQMTLASSETALAEITENLEKNRNMLQELLQQDLQELEKEEQIKEAIKRKNYYDFQKKRLKRDITRDNDVKLAAMAIIDELPDDMGFDDNDLFRVAEQSIKVNLTVHEDLLNRLKEIKKAFEDETKDIKDEDIQEIVTLKSYIPILVLHFSVLIENIKEIIEEDELPPFKGLPKFEGWWIEELWKNHQAYFGLYKWKEIIEKLCLTSDQLRAWEIISSNWIFVKRFLSNKGLLAYKYTLAFDNLMRTYCELEEELATTSLESMDKLVDTLIKKEDFSKLHSEHNIITPFVLFKREQLNYKDIKGKPNS